MAGLLLTPQVIALCRAGTAGFPGQGHFILWLWVTQVCGF